MAENGWYNQSITIGGKVFNPSTWSTSSGSPTDLGDLVNLTVNHVEFIAWTDAKQRGGGNMFYAIYSGGSQVGSNQDLHLGTASSVAGKDKDFLISWSGTEDMAAKVNLTLVAGTTYYLNVWFKTYGDAGDDYYPKDTRYYAQFTYSPNKAKIGSTGWTTFSSRVALNLASMTASSGTVTAYYASSANASGVTMTPTTATVAAGEGIMLKGTAGATITIATAASGSTISGNLLVGCKDGGIVEHDDNNGYNYVMVNVSDEAEFQHIESGSYGSVVIPSGKAYLSLESAPVGAPSAIRIIDEVENATNIQSIEVGEKAVKFIKNGQLFIQKDGVVYDAIGRAIR